MKALAEYQKFVAEVDKICRRIQARYPEEIVCAKGCPGNCCRLHLSIFPVEAVALALALKRLPGKKAHYIRHKASSTTTFGPCPLLEHGVCLLYASRLVICRTHGLPMRNRYRGRQAIGVCQKNFQNPEAIPDDAVIDLDALNNRLAKINRQFVSEISERTAWGPRLTVGEALLLQI